MIIPQYLGEKLLYKQDTTLALKGESKFQSQLLIDYAMREAFPH
jgi:hypothetical protein